METNKVKDVKDVYLQPQIEVVEMEMQEGVLDITIPSNSNGPKTSNLDIVTTTWEEQQ